MRWLFPIVTGKTFFDTSTIIHLAFWIFFGSCLAYARTSLGKAMLIAFAIAAAWEIFERYAELRWALVWQHPESWLNAWVSDPLTAFVGVWFAYYLVSKQ